MPRSSRGRSRSANEKPIRLPFWTKYRVVEGEGRDPLGLARVSNSITDALLPGITTLTNRARYYSFFTWAVREALRESGGVSPRFVESFTRRDDAFLLACIAHHEPEDLPTGVVGSHQGNRFWRSGGRGNIELDFRTLPASKLGGLDQYYRGAMRSLGLLTVDESTGLDAPTEDLGIKLADEFASSIASSTYIRKQLVHEDELSRRAIKDLGATCCVCRLGTAPREQLLLRSIFFQLVGPRAGKSSLQRATLVLLLDIIDFATKSGDPLPADYHPSYWLLRRILYFDRTPVGVAYEPPSSLMEAAAFWQAFQAHWYLSVFLEHMAQAVLELLRENPTGLNLEALTDQCVREQTFRDTLNDPNMPLKAWMKKLMGGGFSEETSERFHAKWGHDSGRSEETIFDQLSDLEDSAPSERASLAFYGISCVVARNLRNRATDAWTRIGAHAPNQLWPTVLISSFEDAIVDGSQTLGGQFQRTIAEQIMAQHDFVLYDKNRLENRRIGREGQRFVYVADIHPSPHSSRLQAAFNILDDLGLLSEKRINDEIHITLSRPGTKLRADVLRELDGI